MKIISSFFNMGYIVFMIQSVGERFIIRKYPSFPTSSFRKEK